ncbi:hypothetical protein AltI4_05700 [Alteromonas sp. I4]|nr:hypothetical protein AltI4_05700 [Alteromonas sp. I4]
MKYGLVLILILGAFSLGYWTGTNQAASDIDSNTKQDKPNALTQQDVEAPSVSPQTQNNEHYDADGLQPVKPLSNNGSDMFAESEYSNPDSTPTTRIDSPQEATTKPTPTTTDSLARHELKEWQEKYSEDLKARMQDVLGEASDFMFDKVSSESPLLTKPTAETPLETDIAWRYQAEQIVTDFINTNINDPATEILQVMCIQKMCEATLTGPAQQSAIELHIEFMKQKPFDLNNSSPIFFVKEDDSYWLYLILTFN